MQLLGDKILVKPKEVEEKNSFGIILPEYQKNKDLGLVISVGPRVQFVKVGDTVKKFMQVTGVPVDFDGSEHIILREGSEVELVIEN